MTAYATKFTLTETDATININDAEWYVFTRGNIDNNPEIEEVGMTYNGMHSLFYDNSTYLYSVLFFYESDKVIELLLTKNASHDGVANLTQFSDDDVMYLAKEVAGRFDTEVDYSIYKKSEYKFIELDWKDSSTGFIVNQYITIINGENYTFTFRSETEFEAEDINYFEAIVNSIEFDIDPNIQNTVKTFQTDSSIWDNVLTKTIGGAVVGGGAAAAVAIINKMKKKSQKDAPSTFNNTDEL